MPGVRVPVFLRVSTCLAYVSRVSTLKQLPSVIEQISVSGISSLSNILYIFVHKISFRASSKIWTKGGPSASLACETPKVQNKQNVRKFRNVRRIRGSRRLRRSRM